MSRGGVLEVRGGGFRLVYSGGTSFDVYGDGDRPLARRPIAGDPWREMVLYAQALGVVPADGLES